MYFGCTRKNADKGVPWCSIQNGEYNYGIPQAYGDCNDDCPIDG